MSDISLNAFPQNNIEALAMLYVKSRDLSGKTPEEICKMYWEAYHRIVRCSGDAYQAALNAGK